MGEGCEEKLDWEFIKFIYTTFYTRKKKMKERFRSFQETEASKNIIILNSKKQIQDFLIDARGK